MRTIIVLLIGLLSAPIFAQKNKDGVYDPSIASVQLFNIETNDQTPFIKLGGRGFALSFDVLDKYSETYYYTVKHYDRNWEEDGLFESEYLKGYNSAKIKDNKPSFNTNQAYTHYSVNFPNNEMTPIISGNYAIIVYKSSADKPIFIKRFSIYETSTSMGVKYERNLGTTGTYNQRVSVEASPSVDGQPVQARDLSLCIMQNNNWSSALCGLQPVYTTANLYRYNQSSNAFEGGNEFYVFDTKNFNTNTNTVEKVGREGDRIVSDLRIVEANQKSYTYNPDVNGAYYFRSFDLGNERDASTEGDYSEVRFRLQSEEISGKDIYIVGLFNNYELSDKYKMKYDSGLYTLALYLKQGYYNYTFATKDRKTGKVSLGEISKSFWETENLYQSFMYYSSMSDGYDRIIGYAEVRAKR